MITRHHVILALVCSLIVFSSLIFSNPLIVAIISTGTCLGAILPDIHMSRPRHLSFLTIAWGIVQVPRMLCVLVLDRIYAQLGYPVRDPFDKRLTHSIPGVLFIAIFTGVLFFVPAMLINSAYAGYMGIFLGGIFLGLGLHMAEDLFWNKKRNFPSLPIQCDEGCWFDPSMRSSGFSQYCVPNPRL